MMAGEGGGPPGQVLLEPQGMARRADPRQGTGVFSPRQRWGLLPRRDISTRSGPISRDRPLTRSHFCVCYVYVYILWAGWVVAHCLLKQ